MKLSSLSSVLLIMMLAIGCTPDKPTTAPPSKPALSGTPMAAQPSPEFTPREPRVVPPGQLLNPDGKSLPEGGPLGFIVLGTEVGNCTIGCWPGLQPSLRTLLVDRAQLYQGAQITITDDFITVTPARPLAAKETALKNHPFRPAPGLAYANSQGVIWASRTDAPPPKGSFVIGQSTFDLNTVDDWDSNLGNTVHSAGGLRT